MVVFKIVAHRLRTVVHGITELKLKLLCSRQRNANYFYEGIDWLSTGSRIWAQLMG